MITKNVAGHAFVNGQCSCGRRWLDIQWYTKADVGQPGIAHMGNLNGPEAEQIEVTKREQDARFGLGVDLKVAAKEENPIQIHSSYFPCAMGDGVTNQVNFLGFPLTTYEVEEWEAFLHAYSP
jgi:hypothetical protein